VRDAPGPRDHRPRRRATGPPRMPVTPAAFTPGAQGWAPARRDTGARSDRNQRDDAGPGTATGFTSPAALLVTRPTEIIVSRVGHHSESEWARATLGAAAVALTNRQHRPPRLASAVHHQPRQAYTEIRLARTRRRSVQTSAWRPWRERARENHRAIAREVDFRSRRPTALQRHTSNHCARRRGYRT
jgi:hypothetical protein